MDKYVAAQCIAPLHTIESLIFLSFIPFCIHLEEIVAKCQADFL